MPFQFSLYGRIFISVLGFERRRSFLIGEESLKFFNIVVLFFGVLIGRFKYCNDTFTATLVKDPSASINHVIRRADDALFWVAYSRHIVRIYAYHGGDDV
ncbi:topless-related protein 1 isoform X1 [Senna tora]|uniref:Topless-related protein 1 isoform X1 n=1 Tax=Senna tora TaxID=362788 RepID=A0A834T1B2_9FABA|nr:topless-related protein 1 isoform X1 [Senna tora]